MVNNAATLNALIVTAPNDVSLTHQYRANGDSTRRQPLPGFFESCREEWIRISWVGDGHPLQVLSHQIANL